MKSFQHKNNELTGFEDRFWFWHGSSGKRYIHSIYSPDSCPPLPGAVFIHVKKLASGKRVAVDVGRFSHDWDYVEALIKKHQSGFGDVDEIHVHLLANNDADARQIVADLQSVIEVSQPDHGFHEEPAGKVLWQANLFETPSLPVAV